MMVILIELQLGYLVSSESKFFYWHAVIEPRVIVKTVVQAMQNVIGTYKYLLQVTR